MRWLPGTMDQLLRTGQLQVETGAGAAGHALLRTRIGLGGDVLVFVDRDFAAAARPALVEEHRRAARAALRSLRRMHGALVALVSSGTFLVFVALPWAGAAISLVEAPGPMADRLAAAALPAVLGGFGAAFFRRLRRWVARWVATRVLARYVRLGQ